MTAIRPRTEREVEQRVIATLVSYGCTVYRLSQGYRKDPGGTRQSPGVPDLWWFCPTHWCAGWFETKTPAGLREHARLSTPGYVPTAGMLRAWRKVQGQKVFRERCRMTETPYAMGGVEEVHELMGEMRRRPSGHWVELTGAATQGLPDDLLEDEG